jgi:hypothetical protein
MEQIGKASIKHGFRPLLVESWIVNS